MNTTPTKKETPVAQPPSTITIDLSREDRLLLEQIRDNIVDLRAEVGKSATVTIDWDRVA